MVRGKTQMRRIENTVSRNVTFSKRKSGLLKKAYELSVLCEAEVGCAIFSPTGMLHEFASSSSMQETIERYRKHKRNNPPVVETPEQQQHLKDEIEELKKEVELLEASNRKLMGEDLGSCTNISELEEIEQQLEKTVITVRALKTQRFSEEVNHLMKKGENLDAENAILLAKYEESNANSYVDTDLFLGPPQTRLKQHPSTNETTGASSPLLAAVDRNWIGLLRAYR